MPPRIGTSTCGTIVVQSNACSEAAVRRIDAIDEPRKHVRRNGSPVRIARNQLGVHRSRLVRQEDRAHDPALAKIPEAQRASQLRVAGHDVQRAGRIDEVARNEQVPGEIGVDAVRIEFAVRGRHRRILGDEAQMLVELHDATAGPTARRSHVRHEKAAFGQRQKIVGDARVGRVRRQQELRMPCIRDVEEEDVVLTFEHAQQTAAREDVSVERRYDNDAARCRCFLAAGRERC